MRGIGGEESEESEGREKLSEKSVLLRVVCFVVCFVCPGGGVW